MIVRSLLAEHYLLSDAKVILIDLRTCNFVHAKTFLRARCVQACHHVRNLSSHALDQEKLMHYSIL